MSSSTNNHNLGGSQRRAGFTLTELLIVIAIIGLLVGLLSVVAAGAIKRSQEFAIQSEITQMNQALESFRTKYGFYPPSQITDANQVRRILARIAPNHQEDAGSIQAWMNSVGNQLDAETSLVYWLSGLPSNKQRPLQAPNFVNDTVPRETFFEFDTAQLEGSGNVRSYRMPFGRTNGNLFYRYREASSYNVNTDYHFVVGGMPQFVNPDTFQLTTAGLDGEFARGGSGDLATQEPRHADNLCNFADGRLDKYITENEPLN